MNSYGKLINFGQIDYELLIQNVKLGIPLVFLSAFCIFFCYEIQVKRNTIIKLNNRYVDLMNRCQLLSATVKEKDILLKEIHHRVKNNLQLVMSLLSIQAQDSQNTTIHEFLEKGHLRVNTMALIHQSLYQSDNFDYINFQDYLEKLVANIKNTFAVNQVDIAVKTNGNTFDLDTAIPLGLIINELVCNSLKHAFPADLRGQIYISIQKSSDLVFELQVGDDGVGIPTNSKDKSSIGLELVSLLVSQLQGKLELINQSGTHYKIEFVKLK
jgi:two-component sensor histidine kinase